MARVANGGARTPTGALQHFLAAYSPAELALARSDYLRPPVSPARHPPTAPRSALSLRADSEEPRPRTHAHSAHALRRQGRARSPPSPPSPPSTPSPELCLPLEPIPPPELFDF